MAKLDTDQLDLNPLTDAELNELRVAVLTCQEQRAKVAAIPQQVLAMAQQFRDAGGDPALLTLEQPADPPAADVADVADVDQA